MKVLAHRGYHAVERENTLEACRAALALGVDGIETDTWSTTDGVLVLFHDRFTPGGREVSALTHAELSAAVGFVVPTLEEALALSHDILWNIELKSPETIDAVIRIVRAHPKHRFLLTSFYHDAVVRLSRELPVDCGLLISHRPLDVASLVPATAAGPGALATIVWDAAHLDEALALQARNLGLKTFVYGLHTADDHARVSKWSVDAVITDHPQLARGSRS